MTGVFDTVVQFLEQDGWAFTRLPEEPILQMVFLGESGRWFCYAETREEPALFVFYSVCPVNVPEEKHVAAAELLTRVNYDLVIGNFEMDFSDGEVRYKTSLEVTGDALSLPLVQNAVYLNVLMMDRYLPGIMSVVYGDVSPVEALTRIEGETPELGAE